MGFILATGFHRQAKLFEPTQLNNLSVDGRTRWAKPSSRPVNLPGA